MAKEWLEFFRDTQDVFAWTYKDLRKDLLKYVNIELF
jgi:hypothetical protein